MWSRWRWPASQAFFQSGSSLSTCLQVLTADLLANPGRVTKLLCASVSLSTDISVGQGTQ